MKRARTLFPRRTPVQAHDVVRDLCASIDAARRGKTSHARSEIRRAVTLGAKLLATGAIDSRGAALINGAAVTANIAIGARAPGMQGPGSVDKGTRHPRRINLSTNAALPPDQSRSADDEQFDRLLDLLSGCEAKSQQRDSTA